MDVLETVVCSRAVVYLPVYISCHPLYSLVIDAMEPNYPLIPLVMDLLDDEAEEDEQVVMAVAQVAAGEIMELEEGLEFAGEVWVPITVDINEYHAFPDPVFKLHFRMEREVFDELVTAVRSHLVDKGRLKRERTPFSDIMLMVVWLMATPDTFRSVALRFGVRPGTLYYFYTYIIEALTEMAPQYISWPEAEERHVISEAFHRATSFPGVCGSIDCTHVYITAPTQDAGAYINRHHRHSINVQAVVDNNLLVRSIHVGEVGSMNDNRVFRRSKLYDDILTSAPGVVLDVDEHLVGDGAYTLTDFMMIPHVNNGHLTHQQLLFNRMLSQCRVRVENAFARGKGKWRRLKHLHARNRENVVGHITASFVLHNFLILNGVPILEEGELGRPINNNQMLGDEVFEDVDDPHPEPDERAQLVQAAEARGIEKRLFIMNHILQMDDHQA